ncbi:hypothetical protein [Kordiimonas pumila]|uniref:Acyltransferase 3 domain-containing protein n=1 Tax=Kordiimonas pumila TaxID=2161677 RepID=A0ABV7D6T9_9PROT|nr:hypothetical protein [Kordiimonas pumila]
MLELAMSRLWAKEVLIYHCVSYICLALFLVGAAKYRGEKVSLYAFFPVLQYYDLGRKAGLPAIAGLLMALGTLSVYTTDFFYGFVSMVRFAGGFVLVPAYWYIWYQLVSAYKIKPLVFYGGFIPIITANIVYFILGLGWLLGKQPFAINHGENT